jgi:hypothetical protein
LVKREAFKRWNAKEKAQELEKSLTGSQRQGYKNVDIDQANKKIETFTEFIKGQYKAIDTMKKTI